jgi:ribosomal RNA-processing protein 9
MIDMLYIVCAALQQFSVLKARKSATSARRASHDSKIPFLSRAPPLRTLMPDPFFSQPKQRKRKRDVSFAATGRPAKAARSNALGKSRKANGVSAGPSKGKKKVDEELSDSADDGEDVDTMDLRASEGEQSSGEEDAAETPAEKRLRLARLYLEGVEKEARENAGEYDAAELDREIIGQRLRQDVAEGAGKVHLYLADSVRLLPTFELSVSLSRLFNR